MDVFSTVEHHFKWGTLAFGHVTIFVNIWITNLPNYTISDWLFISCFKDPMWYFPMKNNVRIAYWVSLFSSNLIPPPRQCRRSFVVGFIYVNYRVVAGVFRGAISTLNSASPTNWDWHSFLGNKLPVVEGFVILTYYGGLLIHVGLKIKW